MMTDKIAIFYHVLQQGNWSEMYYDQIYKLQTTALYDSAEHIHIGVNGELPMPFELDKPTLVRNSFIGSEINTLTALWEFCQKNPEHKVLYLNSLGVTYYDTIYGPEKKRHWREYLEYFTVEKWRNCFEYLNEYDCVGTEWRAQDADFNWGPPHYSGNFWWANASYINKLDVNYLKDAPHDRFNCEFWIGTGNPKQYNYFNSNRNLYWYNILRSEYVTGE